MHVALVGLLLCCGQPPPEGVALPTFLQMLADQHHLSLITTGLPGGAVVRAETDDLYMALFEAAAQTGVEAAVWRDMLLARPGVEGEVAERIRAGLDDRSRALLLRPHDSGSEWEPGWRELVVETIARMLTGDTGPEAYRVACEAALWMAAPALEEMLRWHGCVAAGDALLRIVPYGPRSPVPPSGDPDQAGEYLLVSRPRHGPDDSMGAAQDWIPGTRTRPLAQALEAEGAMVGEDELMRRLVERGMAEVGLSLGGGETPTLSVEVSGTALEAAQALSNAIGTPVGWADAPDAPFRLRLREVRAGDALVALAALCGAHAQPTAEGRARLEPPACPLDLLLAALPLDMWTMSVSSRDERWVAVERMRQWWWDLLSPEERQALLDRPARLRNLPGGLGQRTRILLRTRLADDMANVVQCIPEQGGPVPLWLYELRADHLPQYILLTPAVRESVGSHLYFALRGRLEGADVVEFPYGDLPADGGLLGGGL